MTPHTWRRTYATILDDEMSLLLDLEKSYQASSKLLAVIDDMLAGFIAGIR